MDEFNGMKLKAVCIKAGMIALWEGSTKLGHEHFHSGITEGEYFKTLLCPHGWLVLMSFPSLGEEE